jgi:hypothetical protein
VLLQVTAGSALCAHVSSLTGRRDFLGRRSLRSPSVLGVLAGSTIIVQSGDAAAAWAAAIAALGASLLTGVITYLVTRRQVKAEDRRWYADQWMASRTATAERLRAIYAPMAQSAAALQAVIADRSVVLSGESVETRDDRHDRTITDALNTVSTVGGQILVESSAQEVRDTYSLIVSIVQHYFASEATLPAGTERAERLRTLVEAILAKVNELLSLARTHLAELERPVNMDP